MCCEALPRQVNYLIDEAVDIGKGANTVVSMLHHYFETHGLGEEHVHLHADNCVGQNKNNTMIHVSSLLLEFLLYLYFLFQFQYLMWRVMRGLHKTIRLSFMLVGHTKFSPDWCFGLFKKKFRTTEVNCLDDLVHVVKTSASVNEVQLVGNQSGESVVNMYDWVGFFASHLKKVPQITRQHHFEFLSTSQGTGVVREFGDSVESEYKLTTDSFSAAGLPEVITPSGLSLQRQWYLFDKIREFCNPESRDLVCPQPHMPLPRSTPQPPSPSPSPPQSPQQSQPGRSILQKRGRICGSCGQTGHNKRTCGIRNS